MFMKISITTKKTHIFYQFYFKNSTYKFYCEKNLQEIATIFFLQNILYKTLFTKYFIENICKFYNFIGNNYS